MLSQDERQAKLKEIKARCKKHLSQHTEKRQAVLEAFAAIDKLTLLESYKFESPLSGDAETVDAAVDAALEAEAAAWMRVYMAEGQRKALKKQAEAEKIHAVLEQLVEKSKANVMMTEASLALGVLMMVYPDEWQEYLESLTESSE